MALFDREQFHASLPPVAQSVIDRLIGRINGVRQAAGDARITVVFAPSELPARILEQAELQGMPQDEIHGVLYKGRAYIVRQNIKSGQGAGEWLSEGVFAQVIEERISQFRHQPPILVAGSVTSVPHMRQASAGGVAGASTGGKIYLFRDANATTADVVQTLWHELVHYGLRRFLTKEQYIAQMQKLYDRDSWVRSEADKWLTSGGDDVKEARKHLRYHHYLSRRESR